MNEDNIFQADECDTFDSDVDDQPTAQSIFMANLSSVRGGHSSLTFLGSTVLTVYGNDSSPWIAVVSLSKLVERVSDHLFRGSSTSYVKNLENLCLGEDDIVGVGAVSAVVVVRWSLKNLRCMSAGARS
ncbi:hypothetical protein Tco_1449290 [Tanacetum coccineum]